MNKNMSKLNSGICMKIKLERIKRGLSQEQLADEANLNRNTIGKIERAEVSPTVETLEKLAKVFGLSFIELVDISKVDI